MASYRAQWPECTIEYRDLTWQEYQDLCTNVDPENIPASVAIDIYKTCLINGRDIRLVTCGIGMFIARHQILNNPFAGDFNSLSSALGAARKYVESNYLVSAQAVVAHTFNYPIEDIKSWTAEKFFLRLAQAEIVTGRQVNPAPPDGVNNPHVQKRLSPRELAEKRILDKKSRN